MLIIQASIFRAGNTQISSSAPTQIVDFNPKIGVQLIADESNTDRIWIGNSDVSSQRGFPLSPGGTVFIPVDNCELLYALANVNNEILYWLVM